GGLRRAGVRHQRRRPADDRRGRPFARWLAGRLHGDRPRPEGPGDRAARHARGGAGAGRPDGRRRRAGACVKVRVPASSANLGSAFDALGLALALYDEVEVEVAGTGLAVEVSGEGAGSVTLDESHLVVRSLLAACARFGVSPPGLAVRCTNAI